MPTYKMNDKSVKRRGPKSDKPEILVKYPDFEVLVNDFDRDQRNLAMGKLCSLVADEKYEAMEAGLLLSKGLLEQAKIVAEKFRITPTQDMLRKVAAGLLPEDSNAVVVFEPWTEMEISIDDLKTFLAKPTADAAAITAATPEADVEPEAFLLRERERGPEEREYDDERAKEELHDLALEAAYKKAEGTFYAAADAIERKAIHLAMGHALEGVKVLHRMMMEDTLAVNLANAEAMGRLQGETHGAVQ